MKIFFLPLLFFLLLISADAQIPPIGIIDFYGLRTVTEQQARAALQIKEGEAVPESKEAREAAEKRLRSLPNIEEAILSFVCCDDAGGKTMLYVGIQEKGAGVLQFRPAPQGSIRLPDEIVKT